MKYLLGFLTVGITLMAVAVGLNYVGVAPGLQAVLGGAGGFVVGIGLPVTAFYLLVTRDTQP